MIPNSTTQYKLDGHQPLIDALKELPEKVRNNVIKSLLRKTGKKFIVDELKLGLNYSQETEKNIRVIGSKSSENKIAVDAGVGSRAYPLRWADLGTKERKTKKGANRGKIIGKDQIQPTIERQIEPIVEDVNENLGKNINDILARKLKRLRKA
jgi:hypothetical protein